MVVPKSNKVFTNAHKIWDTCLAVLAYYISYIVKINFLPLKYRGLGQSTDYISFLLLILIVWYLGCRYFRLYESFRGRSYFEVISSQLKANSVNFLFLMLFIYVLKINVSRIMLFTFLIVILLLFSISKTIIWLAVKRYTSKGYNLKHILIVGSRYKAKETIKTMKLVESSGYKIIGCLEIDKKDVGNVVVDDIKVIGELKDMAKIMNEEVVDEVIFAMRIMNLEFVERYMAIAMTYGAVIRVVPDWHVDKILSKSEKSRLRTQEFLGVMTMTLTNTSEYSNALYVKSMIDYILAIMLLTVSAPLFIIVPVLIKTISPGPVFFAQERCGQNGRRFKMIKFRSMIMNAESSKKMLENENEADGPVFKIENDPRIIPYVGKIIRKTAIDEIPQLFNVLKGEMSIVGPRPPLAEEVERYKPWQRRRLSMKPGITCLWQVTKNRNKMSFQKWVDLDHEYIDNWSLMLDFKIMFKTAGVMLRRDGS